MANFIQRSWRKYPVRVLLIVYGIFVLHFLVSNYVQTIGPNILLASKQSCGNELDNECVLHCPAYPPPAGIPVQTYDSNGNPVWSLYSKGFPFATTALLDGCLGDRITVGVDGTMGYNWLYLAILSILVSGTIVRLNYRPRRKH